MNKKGFAIELIAFLIIGIIVVLFFAGIIYGWNMINNIMSSSSMDLPGVNLTDASIKTITPINNGLQNLNLIALVIIVGYLISTFVVAYYSPKHPIWLIIYFLVTVILVVFSIYISNSYNNIKDNTILGDTLEGFAESNIILSNLPIWVGIIGFFGCVISIVGIGMSRRVFVE